MITNIQTELALYAQNLSDVEARGDAARDRLQALVKQNFVAAERDVSLLTSENMALLQEVVHLKGRIAQVQEIHKAEDDALEKEIDSVEREIERVEKQQKETMTILDALLTDTQKLLIAIGNTFTQKLATDEANIKAGVERVRARENTLLVHWNRNWYPFNLSIQ